jgi:hypothetical protein
MSVEIHVGSWLGDRVTMARDNWCANVVAKKADQAVFDSAEQQADGTRRISKAKLEELMQTATSYGCTPSIKARYQSMIDKVDQEGVLVIQSMDDDGHIEFGSYFSDLKDKVTNAAANLKQKVVDKKGSVCSSGVYKAVDKVVYDKAVADKSKNGGVKEVSAKDLAKLKATAKAPTGCASNVADRYDLLIQKAEEDKERDMLVVKDLDSAGALEFGARRRMMHRKNAPPMPKDDDGDDMMANTGSHMVHFHTHGGQDVSFNAKD